MREIKFRGKSIKTGEWLYGDVWQHNGHVDIVEKNADSTLVLPETVGQYTGLKDKNGKEIYEGDVYHMGDKRILSVVEWHDSGFMGKQIGTYGSREGLQYWREKIEVIGSIYTHPELLEAAK